MSRTPARARACAAGGLLLTLVAIVLAPLGEATPTGVVRVDGGLLYVPSGAVGRRPLIVCVSPGGDAAAAIAPWKSAAERYKWLLFGSSELHNGQDISASVNVLSARIDELGRRWPIDRRRIVSTGLSGGGMLSHGFIATRPDLVAGIVVNTGMMHPKFRAMATSYPRGRFVAFLASPTDFRYREMQGDREFLQHLGWDIDWIEFAGGHTMAPASVYDRAAAWVAERLR